MSLSSHQIAKHRSARAAAGSPEVDADRQLRRPARAVARDVRRLHQLEHAGDSEWTPWIALAGLLAFLVAVYVAVLVTVEGVSHLVASRF